MKKRISFFNIVASLLATIVMGEVIFQELEPRSLIFFVIFLGVGEAFVQLRWRINLICRHCGFDPVTYMRTPAKAAEKVKSHLERRRMNPASLLSPPLDLPRLTKEQAQQWSAKEKQQQALHEGLGVTAPSEEKGRLVSRQI